MCSSRSNGRFSRQATEEEPMSPRSAVVRHGIYELRRQWRPTPTTSAGGWSPPRTVAVAACLIGVLGAFGCGSGPSRPHAACREGAARWHGPARSGATTGSAPFFATGRTYETGKGPVAVAIADLNRDCRPDVVTANRKSETFAVFLNRGKASFAPRSDYRTGRKGSGSESIAIGDVNGDGEPDIVNLGWSALSVFLNNGDGSFEKQAEYRVGKSYTQVTLADPERRPQTGRRAPALLRSRSHRRTVEPGRRLLRAQARLPGRRMSLVGRSRRSERRRQA